MKTVPFLAALAFAVALSPSLARAEASGPDFYRVVGVAADDVLNMRSGPAATFQIVRKIPHNARKLKNLGECVGGLNFQEWQRATPAERRRARFKRWCRIGWGGTWGWVNAGYLAED
jgi:uncharacterized protein YraI